jgi:hypothetical protein
MKRKKAGALTPAPSNNKPNKRKQTRRCALLDNVFIFPLIDGYVNRNLKNYLLDNRHRIMIKANVYDS